jgi:hypothetical protein
MPTKKKTSKTPPTKKKTAKRANSRKKVKDLSSRAETDQEQQVSEDNLEASKQFADWSKKGTLRGFETVANLVGDLIKQVIQSWSDGDPKKAIVYLLGIVQGLGVQVGRLEALLVHSGYVTPPATLRQVLVERLQEGFSSICHSSKHSDKAFVLNLDDISALLFGGGSSPKKEQENANNVITLPVFRKDPSNS